MYRLVKLWGICIAATVFFLVTTAIAQDDDPELEISEIVAHFASEVNSSLIAVEQEDSGIPELQEYLYNAMAMVFYARADVCRELGPEIATVNQDLISLVDLGYLPFWPGDPLADMAPIDVVTPADGFTPNAICLSICPSEYESYLKDKNRERISFDLFIYGPDKGISGFGQVIQPKGNKEWSAVPQGAMYGLGFYIDPVDVVEARKVRQAQRDSEE